MTVLSFLHTVLLTVRMFLAGICFFFLLAGCRQQEAVSEDVSEKSYQGRIVAMGDSLTAGLGVSSDLSYTAHLESLLASSGLVYEVVNSGVSGETSSGALARIDWVLKLQPDIVILVTGANDGLRGIDPALIEKNIGSILKLLLELNIEVVLGGMQMVTNLGPDYLHAFNQIYPRLATTYPVVFMPFFLQGVAARPELNQPDGIHPNGEGYRIIATNLLPFVEEAIGRRKRIDEFRPSATQQE